MIRLCAAIGATDCEGVRNCLLCGPLPPDPDEPVYVNPETYKALEEILKPTERETTK